MTEMTNYRCDVCGEVFLEEESAHKCEAFHIKPVELDSMSFGSIAKTRIPYPGVLILKMDDGAMVKYVFNEVINVPKQEEGEFNVPVSGDNPNTDPVGCGCGDDEE